MPLDAEHGVDALIQFFPNASQFGFESDKLN